MQKIIIDLSGTQGLITAGTRNPSNLVLSGKDGQMVTGIYNPFVYPGFLAPGRTYRKTLTVGSSPTLNLTCINDPATGKFMTASQEGIINIYDDMDDGTYATSRDEVSVNGLGATTLPIYDFEIYQLNGTRKVFYTSYNINLSLAYVGVTDGTYFQYDWSNGGSNANLYTSTVTGSGTFSRPVFLRTASNNFMYIFVTGTGVVNKVDGTSAGGSAGTITANALVIPNKQLVDAADWRNLMYIAVQDNYSTSAFAPIVDSVKFSYGCGVYMWDRQSTVVGTRDYIPIEGVKTINRLYVAHDGKLRMICVAASGVTQIREYNGSSFEVIFELGTSAAPQWWDSVTFSDYATFWVGQDKYIYAHGKPSDGYPNGVYKIGYLTSSAITAGYIGFLYYGNKSEGTTEALFADYRTGSTQKTDKILFNYSASATVTGFSGRLPDIDATPIKTKIYQIPPLSNVKDIKVYFAKITDTTSTDVAGYIRVYLNLSLTAFKSVAVTKADLLRGYITIPINDQYINSVQMAVDYTGVTAVDVKGVVNDMMPWYAVLEYASTNTNK